MNKFVLALGAFCIATIPLVAQVGDWKTDTTYQKATIKKQLTDRFTKYVTFDTQANDSVTTVPSSAGQLKLAKALAKELKKYGAKQVKVDAFSTVTAEIPANSTKPCPTIAFLAHLDTATEATAKNVVPQVHSNYKSGDIVINADKKLVINSSNSPQLARAKGHDIITASGDTLLGADDKTGIAVIMTYVQFLYDHPLLEHGTIKIAFTPDEEIGTGIEKFNVPALAADYAYTIDGSDLGEITNETFNAKSFTAVFEGQRAVHPGEAMNSDFSDNILMASDFHTLLPRYKRPETTANRKGYIYVDSIVTDENKTTVKGIIRAFTGSEMKELEDDVTRAFNTVKSMNYKATGFSLTFVEQYKNMKEVLPEQMTSLAKLAMSQEGITPTIHAARGGTDGSNLSFMGLPTADLFSGQYNLHSVREYADVDVMEAAVRTLIRLSLLWNLQTQPSK